MSPSHAAERPLVGSFFAASALVLAGVSVLVDRSERRSAIGAAGLLLALRLLRVLSGSDETLRAVREGAGR